MKNTINDIRYTICKFLDTRALCTLASVSKDWKSLSEDEKIWKEKLSKITQYEDKTTSSKSIFAQITTLKRKNHNELLSFAKMNPQNAKLILQTQELLDQMNVNGLFSEDNIIALAKSHHETANFIFQTPKFALFIDTQDLLKIAKTNPKIAKSVLRNYVFAYNICKYDLLEIAAMDSEVKEIIHKQYPQSAYVTHKEKMMNEYMKLLR